MKLFSLIITLIFFQAASVFAEETALLSFSSQSSVTEGRVFPVDVFLDTKGATINSVDISIALSKNDVTLSGYQESGGVVKLWIQRPTQDGDTVRFSGSIPGGVSGIKGPGGENTNIPLVRLLFKATSPGVLIVSTPQSSVLLHDGKGTALSHIRSSKTIQIQKETTKEKEEALGVTFENSEYIDDTPPEDISVHFYQSLLFDRTPSILQFSTVDLGSGIGRYDVRAGGILWEDAESPFIVPKKLFPYTITITAYDIVGNTRSAIVQVPGSLSIFSVLAMFVVILSGFLLHTMVKKRI